MAAPPPVTVVWMSPVAQKGCPEAAKPVLVAIRTSCEAVDTSTAEPALSTPAGEYTNRSPTAGTTPLTAASVSEPEPHPAICST